MKEIMKLDTDHAMNPFVLHSVIEDTLIYNIERLGKITEYTVLIVAFFLFV